MTRTTKMLVPMLALAVLACQERLSVAASRSDVTMKKADGGSAGQVTIEETPNGLLVHAKLSGLTPGTHAFHIHAVGKCEPPFTSAGPHFNPANKQHGFENPAGVHGGDLPNVDVPASGSTEVDVFVPGLKLSDLLDADGAALVVHAGADDYKTDPAGNAGDRIACGVVAK